MPILYTRQKSLKPAKKKPGWREAEQQYKQWEQKVAAMSSGISVPKTTKLPPKNTSIALPIGTVKGKFVNNSGTKSVARPELKYRDNPEMLQRELLARQRKFNVAPAYNKGADQLVTEQELENVLRSNKRRS